MNWGIITDLGTLGAIIAILAFVIPISRRNGQMEEQIKNLSRDMDSAYKDIHTLEKESGEIKVCFARIDENLKQIKQALKISE